MFRSPISDVGGIWWKGDNVEEGRVISDPAYEKNHRISDLALTIAQMYGLTLRTTTVGRDLTADLA